MSGAHHSEGKASKSTFSEPSSLARGRGVIAFLGLGAMGSLMATRLLEAGFALHVYNRTSAATEPLAQRGAIAYSTPASCVQGADVIVTMVSNAAALDAILEGPEGVLVTLAAEGRRPGPVVIDMSTIGRAAAVHAAARIEAHGGCFVDAPVSGSLVPAARGELVAMLGGPSAAAERVRPVLDVLCKKVIFAGAVGQGQALKVALNGVGSLQLVAFMSMLALAERAGIPREVIVDTFSSSSFATPAFIAKRDKLLSGDYSPHFKLALNVKDCALNTALQKEVGLAIPAHDEVAADIEDAVKNGLGDLDLFALAKYYGARRSP